MLEPFARVSVSALAFAAVVALVAKARADASVCVAFPQATATTSGDPNLAIVSWLLDSQPTFVRLNQETNRLFADPVDPLFSAGEVRPTSAENLQEGSRAIAEALFGLQTRERPELLVYLDGHGQADGTTPVHGTFDANSDVLRAVLRPALAFVSQGRRLTLNLLVNACHSGNYLMEAAKFASGQEMDSRLELNVAASSACDASTSSNRVIERFRAAHAMLRNVGPHAASRICPTCSGFERIALVGNRIGWAFHWFPERDLRQPSYLWSSSGPHSEFSGPEMRILLEGAHRELARLVQQAGPFTDPEPFRDWMSVYVLIAKLLIEANGPQHAGLARDFTAHLPTIVRAEELYSARQTSVFKRWRYPLENYLEAAGGEI